MIRKIFKHALFITILVILDQLSKELIKRLAEDTQGVYISITSFLRITYVKNFGGVFGLFQGYLPVFTLLSFILIGYVLYTERENISKFNKLQQIAACFLISGALGNMIDRLFRHYVIDMIDFYVIWPFIFNIADIYVNISIVLFLYNYIRGKKI